MQMYTYTTPEYPVTKQLSHVYTYVQLQAELPSLADAGIADSVPQGIRTCTRLHLSPPPRQPITCHLLF